MRKGTACLACKHFLNVSQRGDTTWYYNYCKASPKPSVFNHLTGYMEKPNPEFKFCKEVNHGNCLLFEEVNDDNHR